MVQEDALKEQVGGLMDTIAELETNIEKYKVDYAALIAEVQNIKSAMTTVQEKVNRSISLISNLGSERTRWEKSSNDFKTQMSTMVGDVLLSASFLAYIGFFDHFYRKNLSEIWRETIGFNGIKFRGELSIIEFLSKPSERLVWKSHSLPQDDLCTENAIILKRFNRYPLVIDPSGQATEYIVSLFAEKKISKTSFADDAFMKYLETAIRFGTPLLVQDVEKIDPVLNSVLNKEL